MNEEHFALYFAGAEYVPPSSPVATAVHASTPLTPPTLVLARTAEARHAAHLATPFVMEAESEHNPAVQFAADDARAAASFDAPQP